MNNYEAYKEKLAEFTPKEEEYLRGMGYTMPMHPHTLETLGARSLEVMHERAAEAIAYYEHPPEIYPGYGEEATGWLDEHKEANALIQELGGEATETIQKYADGMPEVVGRWSGRKANPWLPTDWLRKLEWAILGKDNQEQTKEELVAQKFEIDEALTRQQRAEWFIWFYYDGMASSLTAGITSIEDLLSKYPGCNWSGLTQEDLALAQLALDKATAPPPEPAPGEVSSSELAAILTSSARPEPIGMHLLTTEEIFATLRTTHAPTLPTGMEEEDMWDILRQQGYSEEEIKLQLSNEAMIIEAANRWSEYDSQYAAAREGLAELEVPDISKWDRIKTALVQPGLAAMEAIQGYRRYASMPIAGFFLKYLGYVIPGVQPGEVQLDNIWNEMRETDNDWLAMGSAFEDANFNWGLKLIVEILVDPLTYIGFGLYPKLVARVPFIGGALSRTAGAAELGYLNLWDKVVFDSAKRLWWRIPGTASQQANLAMRNTATTVRPWLITRAGPGWTSRNIMAHPATDTTRILNEGIEAALAHPMGTGPAEEAGRAILAIRDILSPEDISRWATELGGDLPVKSITRKTVASIQDVVDHTIGFGYSEILTIGAARSQLIAKLAEAGAGVVDKPATLRIAKNLLEGYRTTLLKGAQELIKGPTTKAILRRIPDAAHDVTLANLKTAAYTKHMQQGMVATQLERIHSSVLLSWRHQLDRALIKPVARSYLAFSLYGPFNILEGAMKSAVGAHAVYYPNGVNYVGVYQDMVGDLTKGQIYELMVAAPRMEMAVLPRTYEAQMATLDKVLHWGPLGWMQKAFVEMPGRVGTMQRAHYAVKQGIRTLKGIAPNETDTIMRTVGKPPRVAGVSRRELNALKETTTTRAFRGPDHVRTVADDINANRFATVRLNEQMEHYTLLPREVKDHFSVLADTGELWRNIDDAVETALQYNDRLYFSLPRVRGQEYSNLVDEIAAHPPTTREGLMHSYNEYTNMVDTFDGYISAVRQEAEYKARFITDVGDKDLFWADLRTQLDDYVAISRKAMEKHRLLLEEQLVSLDIPEAEALTGLLRTGKDWEELIGGIWQEQFRVEQRLLSATPPKERTPEFWGKFKAARSGVWDDSKPARRHMRDYWWETHEAVSGPLLPKAVKTSPKGLTVADVAYLYGGLAEDMPRSLIDVTLATIGTSKEEFIATVTARADRVAKQIGKKGKDLGYTPERIGDVYDSMLRGLRINPAEHSVLAPQLKQMEALKQDIYRIYHTSGMPEESLTALRNWVNKVADDLDKTGIYGPAWTAKREEASLKASKEYYKDFADYTNTNAIDDYMTSLFPFWIYEWHRPFWLARTFTRQPGVMLGLGKYMDYSEEGYIHIPGTSIEFNPLRGTIFMGGMRRLIMRDYPEYYDLAPGFAEVFDFIGRAGFYPGTQITLPMALFGYASGQRRPQLGELLPAMLKTPLNMYMAAFPDSTSGKALRDLVFPDRFRDYMTILAVNKRGYDGPEIWRKKVEGIADEEELAVWADASREIDTHNIYFEQTAVFRYRPEEMYAAWDASAKLIEERTGLTVDQQEYMRRHQMKIAEHFPGLIDPATQDLLAELDATKIWAGSTLPLQPSLMQEEQFKINEFWYEVDRLKETAMSTGWPEEGIISQMELNRRLLDGEINPADWRHEWTNLNSARSAKFEALRNTDRFKGVPVTLEERLAYYEEKGITLAPRHPADDLLELYYSIEPEWTLDPDTEMWYYDFDSMYALQDYILDTLEEWQATYMITQIEKNETEIEKLYRNVSREFIRPYRARFDTVLTLFTPQEQALVKEFYRQPGLDRERELKAIVRADGRLLISSFQSMNALAGKNLRLISPELDAWLYYWRYTDTLLTPLAEETYRSLLSKTGRKD